MSKKILIIDDDPLIIRWIISRLKKGSYRIFAINAASNTTPNVLERAEEILRQQENNEDEMVVMTDIQYGRNDGVDGFAMIDFISSRKWNFSSLKLVAMSSDGFLLRKMKEKFPKVTILHKNTDNFNL